MSAVPRNTVLVGDARTHLQRLPAASVDCVVTSPPYFRLRDYGIDGQIGLEAHVEGWVAELRAVLSDASRVLKPTGSLWLNLGDAYSRRPTDGAAPKSLLLGPERVALGLLADGWVIRNKVIWAKTNPMPNSVRDRLACTWEVIYFATRSRRYHFDLDSIRIPHGGTRRPTATTPAKTRGRPEWAGPLAGDHSGLDKLKAKGRSGHALGKNPGDVWRLPTAGFRGAHFATFPQRLIERPILATCPEKTCARCGLPWEREPHRQLGSVAMRGELAPVCECRTGTRPGLVLDPFMGAGTVAIAARDHERDWLGIELNPEFVALTNQRLNEERRAA